MYRIEKTYTDFNGVERTESFYFHLSEAELVEMEMGIDGGLVEMINKIVAAKDAKNLIKIFKELVLKAYGEKSPDGRQFRKSEEISKAFEQTKAYSDIFMELAFDDEAASKFTNGIIPADLDKNKYLTSQIQQGTTNN